MRRISKKRATENKEYREVKKELFLEDLRKNKLLCFFSNNKIILTEELKHEDDDTLISWLECHHLNNQRFGERLFDKEMLVPSLRKYHTLYHSLDVSHLLKESWYNGFLNRLKHKSFDVYCKEINKQLKSNLITIEEYEQKTRKE